MLDSLFWIALVLNVAGAAFNFWTSWRLWRLRARNMDAISIGEPIRAAIEVAARQGHPGPIEMRIAVSRDHTVFERVH